MSTSAPHSGRFRLGVRVTTQDQATAGDKLAQVRQNMAAGALDAALADLGAILNQDADDIDALYLAAVVLRYRGDVKGAYTTLDRLKHLAPGYSRAHQEEGHLYRAVGEMEAALAAYRRALQLNPALIASVKAQLDILTASGRTRESIRVQAQLERLEALPKALIDVTDLIAQGKLLKAETLCRGFLREHPRNVEAMRLLADIGSRLGSLEESEFLLESAAEFEPENTQVRMDYVQILRKRQKFVDALAQAERLIEQNPNNPQFQSLYAIENMQTGDYPRALAVLDRVLESVPGDPVTLTTKGHALKTTGQTGEAVAAYRDAIAGHPEHGEAYYSLANLKTYQFSDDELAGMRQQDQNSNLGYMDRVYLCFALAKACEDRQDYAASFDYYARGNALKKAQSNYNADRMREEFDAMRKECTPGLFASHAGHGEPAPDPIFVLGLPRAGSTLLEQILSSHSQVDGTLELPNILSLSQRLRRRKGGKSYPELLQDLGADELAEFGRDYIEQTRVHRQQAPFFVDKMPNNFRHIGLIKLILPNAKVIDARREPMSCCFSGFKQLFAEGQEFTYSLEDLGRYYADYVDLMAHWDEVLPDFVLRMNHEDVVDDLESQVHRMLTFCGLPFEDACLRYYETERNVRTPSSEQVRQPIFRDSLSQWRNYEPYLQPLKEALEPVLTAQQQ